MLLCMEKKGWGREDCYLTEGLKINPGCCSQGTVCPPCGGREQAGSRLRSQHTSLYKILDLTLPQGANVMQVTVTVPMGPMEHDECLLPSPGERGWENGTVRVGWQRKRRGRGKEN